MKVIKFKFCIITKSLHFSQLEGSYNRFVFFLSLVAVLCSLLLVFCLEKNRNCEMSVDPGDRCQFEICGNLCLQSWHRVRHSTSVDKSSNSSLAPFSKSMRFCTMMGSRYVRSNKIIGGGAKLAKKALPHVTGGWVGEKTKRQ